MADESDFLLFLEVVDEKVWRKEREFKPRLTPFDEYDDEKIRRRFCLSKTTVVKLLEQVDNS